ncbi:MAG TPA: lysophospholipid acyltransferase family protein [Actinomycetota bacterium]|nr:lysophospholipid acyltransferase family protein [Actinomycetota bacterium]
MAEAEIIRLHDHRTKPDADGEAERKRCAATTATGRPCRNFALPDAEYCSIHARGSTAAQRRHPAQGIETPSRPPEPEPTRTVLDGIGDFLRRRLDGAYPVDDFGYDPELHREVLLPLQRALYERYFRVRTLGVDRIPHEGAALLVGNHSGTIPVDAVMVQHAVATEHPRHRTVRNVAADLAFNMPFVGHLARKTGNAVACDEDAHELLRRGEVVGVYPEGYKGVGKGWKDRYKLQRFGRGGFIEVALRTRTPIVPVAIVGAEEAFPMIANAKLLARTFGFPYFPITPTFPLLGPLGLLPLPSRWLIEFGEPIPMDDYPEDAAEDAMLVFDLTDRIRDTIQQMLYRNLSLRGRAFI